MQIQIYEKKLVYIVEDSPVQQELLKVHFEKGLGEYEVQTFDDPETMIGNLSPKPYAIILDHQFEGNEKTGLDYLKILRSQHKSIPIIYYTSKDDRELRSEVLSIGAEEYIVKNSASFVYLRTALDQIKEKKKKESFFRRLFGNHCTKTTS